MPFLLLLLLYLACLAGDWERPRFVPNDAEELGIGLACLLSWGVMGLTVLAAAVASWRTRCRLMVDPGLRDNILRRYSSLRLYHLLGMFVSYGLALYFLGWGWAVQEMCNVTLLERNLILPGAELLLLAPLLAALVLSWAFFYGVERALHDTAHPLMGLRPYWSRWAYVGFHMRQYMAMVLLPVGLLIVFRGLERLIPDVFNRPWFPWLAPALLIMMIASLPWVMRLVLGLQSLPAGELRDRLAAVARRLNFRCSDILLWNTRNGVANALVVGIFPNLRYVVLSDRLLNDLTTEEVEAVFGHEAGHVKHHHMAYYLGFLFISLFVLATAWETLHLVPKGVLETPLFLGSLGAYIFVVFGFLSRRCERQADIYGCRAVSCGRSDCTGHDELPVAAPSLSLCPTGIRTFIHALEKVALLNGISRSRPGWLQSWQHSTIDKRVLFLQGMLTDPTLEKRFQRRVMLVKWLLMVGLAVLLGLLTWNLPREEPKDADQNAPHMQGYGVAD